MRLLCHSLVSTDVWRTTQHLLGDCLDFIRRHFMESSCKSPFVAEWVTDTQESFTPEHVSGVHKSFRAVVFHGFDHRGTVIDVQMSRAACTTKAGWTWHATMFREFFADERVPLPMRNSQCITLSSGMLSSTCVTTPKRVGVECDLLLSIVDTQLRREFAGCR